MLRRAALVLFLLGIALATFEWVTFPDVTPLQNAFPRTTSFMEIRRQELRDQGKIDSLLYTPVAYGRISPYLRRGVLVAEDDTFYQHEGVDVKAMREAVQRDWAGRKFTHGGSTITQQLAKNLYLSPSRNPLRKVKEYFIARSLEKHLTKKRILELYLNVVEMGERVYGAEAAAQFYFDKAASSLTPNEAALLAGCLPNPRLMNPGTPNKRLRWRQRMVLARMGRWGYLFENEVLTEKKPEAAAPPAVDTALQQTPAADGAPPAPETETSTSTEPEAPATSPPATGTAAPTPDATAGTAPPAAPAADATTGTAPPP